MIGWVHREGATKEVASYRFRLYNPSLALAALDVPNELFNEDRLNNYKVVIFSKAYSKSNLYLAEKLLNKNIKVIFDFCDNHLFNPNNIESYETIGNNIREAINLASRTTYSTNTLLSHFQRKLDYQNNACIVIPDLIYDQSDQVYSSPLKFLPTKPNFFNSQKRLVWYGIHGSPNSPSGMMDILKYKDLLEKYYSLYNFKLIVISNSREKFNQLKLNLKVDLTYVEWSEFNLFRELKRCSSVILPITIDEFTLCKSNNRLALPLAMNKTVIADCIPSYLEFANYAYLDDWENGLRNVLSNAKNRNNCPSLLGNYNSRAIGLRWLDATLF